MNFVFFPSFFPAFAFNKDLLLILGLAFMVRGIAMMIKAWRE